MGIFTPNRARKRRAYREQAAQTGLAAKAIEESEVATARTSAAEMARLNVFSSLGNPGTYEMGSGGGGYSGGSGGVFQDGVFKSDTAASQLMGRIDSKNQDTTGKLHADIKAGRSKAEAGILDAEKYGDSIRESGAFKTQSYLTAESNQLLRQEGPAWDRMNESVMGQIYEGAAVQRREQMRQIKNNMAKGGTARRAALAESQAILAEESAMRTRVNESWKANLAMFDSIRSNAAAVQSANYDFMNNLPGTRDSYVQQMNNMSEMYITRAIPEAGKRREYAYNVRDRIKDSNFWGKLLGGAAGLALGGIGGASLGMSLMGGGDSGGGGESSGNLLSAAATGFGDSLGGKVGEFAVDKYNDWRQGSRDPLTDSTQDPTAQYGNIA